MLIDHATKVAVGDIGSYKASETRKISWAEMTSTPFDPLDAAAQMAYHDVDCAQCLACVSVRTSFFSILAV